MPLLNSNRVGSARGPGGRRLMMEKEKIITYMPEKRLDMVTRKAGVEWP